MRASASPAAAQRALARVSGLVWRRLTAPPRVQAAGPGAAPSFRRIGGVHDRNANDRHGAVSGHGGMAHLQLSSRRPTLTRISPPPSLISAEGSPWPSASPP